MSIRTTITQCGSGFFSPCIIRGMEEQSKQHIIKVGSISKARAEASRKNNRYIKEYGEALWQAALLTAYQNGGYEELKHNYNNVPIKYIALLLDAYQYKATEEEFRSARAASCPHKKQKDIDAYLQDLANKLGGRD